MKIANAVYKEIAINWDTISFPLKAGTPVSAAGLVSNDGKAIGLVPETIAKKPLMPSIFILIGGDVDAAEVDAQSGMTISDNAKKSMSGITFYGADGTPAPDPVYNLPTASTTTLGCVKIGANITLQSGKISIPVATTATAGVVKKAANVSTAAGDAPTAQEFNALISALIAAGIMNAAV